MSLPVFFLFVCFFGEGNDNNKNLERVGPTLKFQILIGYTCKNHTKIIIASSPVIKVAWDQAPCLGKRRKKIGVGEK